MAITINGTTGLAGVDGSASTPAVQGADTNTGVFFPAADTVAIATGGSERLRADSSGNVGIGTSSPTARLTVVTAGTNQGEIRVSDNATYYGAFARVQATDEVRLGSYGASQNLTFYTVSSERARITSDGNLLVGTTSSAVDCRTHLYKTVTSGDVLRVQNASGSTGVAYVGFRYGTGTGTETGYISTNGTTTTYSTSSDYRLKENVQPMVGALARVAQLKPCTYTWKSTGEASQGFIAHELQAVVPECVVGEKDAVNEDGSIKPQGIDTSFLVATLTAAIQELTAKLDAAEARIAALEAA